MFGSIGNLRNKKIVLAGCCGLLALLMLAGCSSAPVKKETVYFPPAPDEPRIQFLVGINTSDDIEDNKDAFSLFLTGKQNQDKNRFIYKPYGVVVHKGKIYVCDLGGRIVIIDPAKKSFGYLHDEKKKTLNKPINLTFDEQDNIYVADSGSGEVIIFNSNGDLVRKFGKEEKLKPVDVAVDKENLYVLDMAGSAIRVYDLKSGAFDRAIGKTTDPTTTLALPSNLTMDPKGIFYVTNVAGNKVVKLDKDGHFLGSFGQLGDGFGEFGRPKGITLDDEGRIYVVDAAIQNVQIFNPAADRLLLPFGNPGLPRGSLNLPAGVAVVPLESMPFFKKFIDPSFEVKYLIFVTNQYGTSKLSVYGMGQRKGANLDSYKAKETAPPVAPAAPAADAKEPAAK